MSFRARKVMGLSMSNIYVSGSEQRTRLNGPPLKTIRIPLRVSTAPITLGALAGPGCTR